jgi:hypothetical protein
MNYKQMYQNLAVTNYFLFKYNLGEEEFEDFSELEIPN